MLTLPSSPETQTRSPDPGVCLQVLHEQAELLSDKTPRSPHCASSSLILRITTPRCRSSTTFTIRKRPLASRYQSLLDPVLIQFRHTMPSRMMPGKPATCLSSSRLKFSAEPMKHRSYRQRSERSTPHLDERGEFRSREGRQELSS